MRSGLVVAMVLGLAIVPEIARAQPPPPVVEQDEADRLFNQGKAAYEEGKVEDAYRLYLQAWQQKQTHDIAGNLAQAELKLGKKKDAANHIQYALTHFPPTVKQERRKVLEDALAELETSLTKLTIVVNQPGAEIRVDGQVVGQSPMQIVYVEPGAHVVDAQLGPERGQCKIECAAGQTQNATVQLEGGAATTAAAGPNMPIVLVGAGLTVVALGSGIGLAAAAGGKGSDGDKLLAQLHQQHLTCTSLPLGQCATLLSLRQSHDSLANVSTAMFIGAGVLGAATLGYALWPRRAKEETTEARLVPTISPGLLGVSLQGSL
jgi:hypothetical protein